MMNVASRSPTLSITKGAPKHQICIPKEVFEALTNREQQLLKSANAKIEAINRDIKTSKGLTEAEMEVAAKIGLIDPDQRWWWTEDWQKDEREAHRDIAARRVSRAYDNLASALADLKKQA